jgi:hypothetical protein
MSIYAILAAPDFLIGCLRKALSSTLTGSVRKICNLWKNISESVKKLDEDILAHYWFDVPNIHYVELVKIIIDRSQIILYNSNINAQGDNRLEDAW